MGQMPCGTANRRFAVAVAVPASSNHCNSELTARAGFGGSVKTLKGTRVRIHRVNLDDFVLNMPRSATPIYPKDACTILTTLNV